MKTLKHLFGLVALLVLLTASAEAQIIDRTEDKAKKKSNQRIDNGIDKSLDKIEGLFKKKPKKDKEEKSGDSDKPSRSSKSDDSEMSPPSDDADMAEMMKMMGGKSITVDEDFSFDHNVVLKTETFNAKGKLEDTFNHTLHLSDDFDHFGMDFSHEEGSGQMVYEFVEKRILMMTEADGQTFGMVSYVDDTYHDGEVVDVDNAAFGKTGNKKVILGYKCEEWAGEEDGQKTNVWVAEDPELMFSKAFAEMAKAQNQGEDQYGDYPNGMMMEMTSVDTRSGEKTIMTCIEVNKNKKSNISTKGYEFMDLSGMGMGR
jgi:hypothetical protein